MVPFCQVHKNVFLPQLGSFLSKNFSCLEKYKFWVYQTLEDLVLLVQKGMACPKKENRASMYYRICEVNDEVRKTSVLGIKVKMIHEGSCLDSEPAWEIG